MQIVLEVILIVCSLFGTVLSQTCGNCQSYGTDFVDGGSYFQNSLSNASFTAVQYFEGCTNDTSYNVLVDPQGVQYECCMTPMSPDDTPEQLTCPFEKDGMYTGEWAILIISNNGDCAPIDYERDFYISVGPQQTTTVSPTIYVSTTTTPVESDTVTSISTVTITASPSTTTVPLATLSPTVTIYPRPSVSIVTKAKVTITKRKIFASVVATTTTTSTAHCSLPPHHHKADPVAQIVATVLGGLGLESGVAGILHHREAHPEPTARSASTEFKRAILSGQTIDSELRERYIKARHDRLALQKRAPDEPTSTFTDPSGVPVTSTTTYTAPTTTVTGTTTQITSITTTPVVTVSEGVSIVRSTVTAPKKTWTNTFWVPATTVYTTRTQDVTLTVTSTFTPARMSTRCPGRGGVIV